MYNRVLDCESLKYTSGSMGSFSAVDIAEVDAAIAFLAWGGSRSSASIASATSLQVAGSTIKDDSFRYSNLQQGSLEELSSAEEEEEEKEDGRS